MIAVIGANGFVGAHVVRALLDRGEDVVGGMRDPGGDLNRVLADSLDDPRLTLARVDLEELESITSCLASYGVDSVVDVTGYPPKLLDPATDVRRRTDMTVNLLEAVRSAGVARLTVTSSTDVYFHLPAAEIPYQEDARVVLQEQGDNFLTQAWAKKVLEVVVGMYARSYPLDLCTARLSGVYGPGYRTYLSLISRLAKAGATGSEIDYDRSRGGVPIRQAGYDLCHAEDVARGVATVHLAPRREHRVYNIGAGRVLTHGEVTDVAVRACPSLPVRTRDDEAYVARRPNAWMSTERIRTEFGWEPQVGLAEGFADYVSWLRGQEA